MSDLTVLDLPPPRAILFDWDDTLVDNWQAIHAAMAETYREMGLAPPPEPDQLDRHQLRSLRDSFPKLFGERWKQARDLFHENFATQHLTHLRVLDDAVELLRLNNNAGRSMAVVSNKTGKFLRREVNFLQWQRYFHRVIGAGDAAFDKPDPAVVRLALADTGIKPEESWFVGDSLIDVECAIRSGCRAILVTAKPFSGAYEKLRRAYGPVTVKRLACVLELLARMDSRS